MDNSQLDAHLRGNALEMAVNLHKVWLKEGHITASAEQQLDDIRYTANRFYEFLKGETK